MSAIVDPDVILDDRLTEGTDGQYIEIDFVDAEGVPIDTSAIANIVGTLRSLDTQETLFEEADLFAVPARASLPGAPGRVRVTFTAADMASRVSREPPRVRSLQTRRLTLRVSHSLDQLFHCSVQFMLRNLGDVETAPVLLSPTRRSAYVRHP